MSMEITPEQAAEALLQLLTVSYRTLAEAMQYAEALDKREVVGSINAAGLIVEGILS